MSHLEAIDAALIDVLYAFDKESSKADTRPDPSSDGPGINPSIRNSGAPLRQIQARRSTDADILSPQIFTELPDGENLYSTQRFGGHGNFDLLGPKDMPRVIEKGSRPPYRYATLIGIAILQANCRCLTLAQIYQWISYNFAFYSLAEKGWQNNVRHNLSLNKNFIKIKRSIHDRGKGHYWRVKPGNEHLFIQKMSHNHFATAIGSLQSTCDWIQYSSPNNEVLSAPSTAHSVRRLDLNDRTVDERSQQSTEPSCVTTETRESKHEGDYLHVPVVQSTLTPSIVYQPRHENETLPLPWDAQMDRIEMTLSLKTDGGIDECNCTLPDKKPFTHVHLPHLMRESSPDCPRFEANRTEPEIAQIWGSCVRNSTKHTLSAGPQVSSSSSLFQRGDYNVPSSPLNADNPKEDFSSVSPSSTLHQHRNNIRTLLGSPARPFSPSHEANAWDSGSTSPANEFFAL